MSLKKLAFIDVETTGCSPYADRVIEVGIVRVENNKIVKKYTTLLNPETSVSPYIEILTGIQAKELEKAPVFADIKDELLALLDDCTFVAHNVRFDYGFIRNEFKRIGINFAAPTFCTVKLSRYFHPEHTKHDLSSIIERFQFKCKNRHRAYDDAYVLWQYYQQLSKIYSDEQIVEAVAIISKRKIIPTQIDNRVIDNLPESPGVYTFYDKNGTPLYVGKSKNIRERVLSHFTNTHTSQQELAIFSEVAHIETHTTSGELSALLLESSMVKELKPFYNRQLRKWSQVYTLICNVNEDGYYVPKIEKINIEDLQNFESILGIFKSKGELKKFLKNQVEQHQLCEKLLGLEKTSSSCFSYKLDICKGACIHKEKSKIYNVRFQMAFDSKRLKKWPYEGPILLEEQNIFENLTESHIFRNWIYCGSVKSNEEGTRFLPSTNKFDYDTYKILHSFIQDRPANKSHGRPRIKIMKEEEFEYLQNN